MDEPNRELGPGEVQIRVTTCGVCASEIKPWNDGASAYPRRLRHEPVGVVLAVGPDVTRFEEGDRITGLFHEAFSDTCIAPENVLLPVP
ncbi:MAG: alcohol dehydrogenase catalytic domain-containing protein, partial [Chloroflexota bacterium]|nr:alcohol dehydrogenase catalytic domain-containing protein [Chloroflexota bacterium]